MRLDTIHHIAIIASDYERSKDFYTRVLGLELIEEFYRAERDSWMGKLAVGGRYLVELFSFPSPPPRATWPETTGLRHLAFEVDDVESTLAELDEAGVRHEELRTDPHTGKKMAFFFDPDDQPLELYER
ncbi:VOC family protein [Herbiconiux sp. L3-i23]|uniref:SMU1112c/YaeR family gloxylase I-like metalloprotein n=1 Tax=Herbiconiux sp. L3-i23 TaxID=2905871 RepID=UPI00206B7E87|nr:VOC family protein [Herbiconiux sp. L3-i23]BDI24086.1 VOC family protein [Herbiconiux sp. L3-i23]